MSYHSSFRFNRSDKITDELIDEICKGLEANFLYNSHTTMKGYSTGAYATLCYVDQLIYNIGKVLDRFPNFVANMEEYEKFMYGSPEGANEIAMKVIEKMGWEFV